MLYSNIAKIEKAKETFVGHMKKRHLYTAAVLLTLSLSACGQDSGNITESSQAAETEASSDKEQELSLEDIKSAGSWDGNLYENEAAGISFNMPESWTASSDEDIAAFIESVQAKGTDYLAMAQDLETGEVMQIAVEDLSVTTPNLTDSMDEDMYIDALRSQLDLNEEQGLEITHVDEENAELSLGGESYKGFTATMSANGQSINQVYAVRKIDDKHMMTVIYITAEDAGTEVLEELFI